MCQLRNESALSLFKLFVKFRDATRDTSKQRLDTNVVGDKQKCVREKWEAMECATITWRVLTPHQSAPQTYNDVTFHVSAFLLLEVRGDVSQSFTVPGYWILIDVVQRASNESSSRVSKSYPAEWKSNHDKSTLIKPGHTSRHVKIVLRAQHKAESFRKSRLDCSSLIVN